MHPSPQKPNEMALLLPPSTGPPLHSPSRTLSFRKRLPLPSYKYHCQGRPLPIPIPIPIPTPTRPCASLSSFPSSSSSTSAEPVLSVLRSHGIPEDACTAILSKFPGIFLRIKPLENLDPKLQFLRSSAGLSGVEVAEILLVNPYLLRSRLHPMFSSFVTFLASILSSKKDLVRVLKSVLCYPTDQFKANLQVLLDHGVPESVIHRILLQYPRSFVSSTEKFVSTLEATERLGLNPKSKIFAYALGVASYMSKEAFSRKVELFKEFGWSEEQLFSVFRRHPMSVGISEAKLRKNTAYFKEVLGWGPDLLCLSPSIMRMSLDERIIPRCAVLNVLMMKGLLKKKKTWCPWRFTMANSRFVAYYVDKYKEEVPEVLEAYQGNVEFTGWGWLKDVPEEEQ